MTTTALGSQIRQARKEKGFTQEQLAETLHVTRQTVSNWENDRFQPDYETLKQLADALSLDGLLPLMQPDAQAPEAPATVATLESPPLPTARIFKKRRWLWILAAAMLLGGVAVLIWQPWQMPSVSYPYPLAWFQQEQPNEAGKSYVRLYMHEPVVKAERRTPTATPVWRYAIFFKEENGVGFTVSHVDYVYFSGEKIIFVDSQTEDFLHEGLVATATRIGASQYRHLSNLITADGHTTGMGFAMFGTDDNGNELSFHIYLPLENEYH